jgi:excisionase family DNA binding protein
MQGKSPFTELRQTGGEQTMAKKESLLRSKDVAHILDCSPDDVIELARRGKLRASKQGRFWRFKHTDVLTYKKKNDTQLAAS